MAITITDKYGNVIDEFTQWDINRTIYIHGLDFEIPPVIQFSNNSSIKTYGTESILDNDVIITSVPNILLEQNETISIYVYTYDINTREGLTVEIAKKPVRPKKKPDDYIYQENISVVNIVALNNRVSNLYKIVPTGGHLNDNIIQLTSDLNGSEVDVFTVDLSDLLATDEEADEYLFGENADNTENSNSIPFSNPPEKSSALKHLKNVFEYCINKITDLGTNLTNLITQINNALSERISGTEKNIAELQSEDIEINNSIDQIDSSIVSINSLIEAIKNSINTTNDSITIISSDVSDIQNDITVVKQDISNINQSITDINDDIALKYSETSTNISGISGRLDQAEETITLLSDITHPVNSIFISKNDTPLEFGIWEQLKTETIKDETENNEDITLYYWIRIE